MKKDRRIPTILGLFLLFIGVFTGVILVRNASRWLVGAKPEITPKQIKITNITDSSFTVSWITDEQTAGFVQYGTGGELSLTALDDRDQLSGQQGKFWTHHITLKNLKPATNYFFKINSGGKTFDNNGQPYQVLTAPTIGGTMPPNDVAYGTITKQDGSPAEGIIVYLSLANATPLSTLTKASGSWVIPLNLARSADLSSWVVYDKEASVEEIFVQGGPAGTATAVAVTKYDSPLPTITLGSNFDFRKAPSQPTPTSGQSSSSSRFSVEEGVPPSASLTIINPSEGEKVSTSIPEFLGTGPAGESLTITVNSPETLTSQVTINEDGTWSWVPPSGLSPGQHTVTASLADGRKITRSFTVLAAGSSDLPSFTASPSATITPTITPTPTPTPLPSLTPTPTSTTSARVSHPSTEGGIPRPGNLTPTFLFSIMGGGLIILGILSNILLRKT